MTQRLNANVRELVDDLGRVELDGPALERWMPERVRRLMETESVVYFTLAPNESAIQVESFALVGQGADRGADVFRLFDTHARTSSGPTSLWTVRDLERGQQNRALLGGTAARTINGAPPVSVVRHVPTRQLRARLEAVAQLRPAYVAWGMLDAENLRAVVCDGRRSLGYIAALQHGRFDPERHRLLTALLPALRRRMLVEERLHGQGVAAPILPALLEQVGAAAFLLARGQIVAFNSAARSWLSRHGVRARVIEAARRRADPDFVVIDLAARGVPEHVLVTRRLSPTLGDAAVRLAAERHALTPREREVLAAIASGSTNQSIAVELGCGVRTIETHVSRILEKTDCASRSELVAHLWSQLQRE